ncbi:MAG TPA: class II aldolase/adducin family protein [Xanthobacteraceae bacterium]|nr:class II aldolase/adducin family protein [Xanthobacteraceae bacterium]
MPDQNKETCYELALASRMLANEGVLDAFGHVSLRHPGDPKRFLLSRSRSPQLVEPADILEFSLDAEPIVTPTAPLFAERVIHGCIYQARPDVMAVCHHHAGALMPFCISGMPLVPVFHLGAAGGAQIPFWDQQDEFGDTNLLVAKLAEGHSLARALGQNGAVLMRRHGATVVGGDLRELVSRSIFMCQNAIYQLQAHLLGNVAPLTGGETKLAGSLNALPNVVGRTWEYWSHRLAEAGRLPPALPAAKQRPSRQSAARRKPVRSRARSR